MRCLNNWNETFSNICFFICHCFKIQASNTQTEILTQIYFVYWIVLDFHVIYICMCTTWVSLFCFSAWHRNITDSMSVSGSGDLVTEASELILQSISQTTLHCYSIFILYTDEWSMCFGKFHWTFSLHLILETSTILLYFRRCRLHLTDSVPKIFYIFTFQVC